MSNDNTIGKNTIEFSPISLNEELEIEEDKVLITTGMKLEDDGCILLEGALYFV